jgi:hypothetical protein
MFLGSSVTSDEPRVHHIPPQTTQAGMQWKSPASLEKKKNQRMSFYWRSCNICIPGCRRSHPRWIHASGYNNRCERVPRHATTTAWHYSQEEAWTSVARCDQPAQRRSPTQRTTDTSHCCPFTGHFGNTHINSPDLAPKTPLFWFAETGRRQFHKTRQYKWLLVNRCKFRTPVYVATDYLSSDQDRVKA